VAIWCSTFCSKIYLDKNQLDRRNILQYYKTLKIIYNINHVSTMWLHGSMCIIYRKLFRKFCSYVVELS
jgi:hypothetical protein